MERADLILILGVALISVGSFLAGLVVSQFLQRGRRKGKHAKGKGRHAK